MHCEAGFARTDETILQKEETGQDGASPCESRSGQNVHSQQLRVPFLTLRRFAGGSEPSSNGSDMGRLSRPVFGRNDGRQGSRMKFAYCTA